MKICKHCCKELQDNELFCNNCGNNTKDKHNPQKIIIPIIVVLIVSIVGIILSKDKILYSYYKSKGDKETSILTSIDYYSNALEIKYTDDIVKRISDKIKEDENFEDTLMDLKGIVNEEDLNNIYIKTYVNKAKENFNNKNYETTLKYLNKAEKYNYNIETFEYYNDLLKAIEKSNTKENKEVIKQDVHIYKNNVPVYVEERSGYQIISDSDRRYLTKEELYGYDKNTLALIRNEIFARNGYIFKKQEYINYFESMPWYYPNSSFKGTLNELNKVERYNVNLIKSME